MLMYLRYTTPEDTPEWDSVMSSFLKALRCEARTRH